MDLNQLLLCKRLLTLTVFETVIVVGSSRVFEIRSEITVELSNLTYPGNLVDNRVTSYNKIIVLIFHRISAPSLSYF